MTTPTHEQPDPELHEVGGAHGGSTYETPLTLGPDSDHVGDPIRDNQDDPGQATQPSAIE